MYTQTWTLKKIHLLRIEPWTQTRNEGLQGNVDKEILLSQVADDMSHS